MRVVAPDGEQIGLKEIDEALWLANQLGMDLVEVAPGSDPPVCRLMDYGKYKYEQSVKAREGRKKSSRTVIKEVKFKTKIDSHDFDTKVRRAAGFLEEGHKVKAVVMFFGREITHPERGRDLLDRMVADLDGIATVESPARLDGRNMTMVLLPDKAGIKARAEAAAEAEKAAAEAEARAEAQAAAPPPVEPTPEPIDQPEQESAAATTEAPEAEAEAGVDVEVEVAQPPTTDTETATGAATVETEEQDAETEDPQGS
ncbi:MAG: translation initiation factor IF-3 [Acidimicrobiia bacterium]|nr:translation initiation factor IF-3 [Acidimicrobiia bacterium]